MTLKYKWIAIIWWSELVSDRFKINNFNGKKIDQVSIIDWDE